MVALETTTISSAIAEALKDVRCQGYRLSGCCCYQCRVLAVAVMDNGSHLGQNWEVLAVPACTGLISPLSVSLTPEVSSPINL